MSIPLMLISSFSGREAPNKSQGPILRPSELELLDISQLSYPPSLRDGFQSFKKSCLI